MASRTSRPALIVWLVLVVRQFALVIACIYVTYIFWNTPQLSYNTLALAFLTLGIVFGAWVVVLGKGRGYALASGAMIGRTSFVGDLLYSTGVSAFMIDATEAKSIS